MSPQFDPLRVAVRVFTERVSADPPRNRGSKRRGKRRLPQRTLVFDCETTVDPTLSLTFGVWRYYIDRWSALPGVHCVQEGILYADDLPESDPDGFAELTKYVNRRRADVAAGRNEDLQMLSRTEFVERILFRLAYKQQATIVGFNLPFDLSRLAIAATSSRGRFAGGHSLRLWERERFRPRISSKSIDSRRTLIGFTSPSEVNKPSRGHFLDLRTLSFALTDRGHSLESACQAFGVPYTKRQVVHGEINENYINYCREDVEATAPLYGATMAEFRRHPIDLQATKAFSPASVGKAYLETMGIRPILERQPDFDRAALGWSMSAFFGGRAECRIRKTPLPVVYLDFLSMYPSVNALMGTWRLVVAREIAIDDATEDFEDLLAEPDLLTRCFSRPFWRQLIGMVEIEPDGDVVPVRATYDQASPDFGIGINPYRTSGTAWFSMGDLVASVLLSGKMPTIRRAIRFRGVGQQTGLAPARIRSMVEVDPSQDDFFRRAIELRREIAQDPAYDEGERARLSQHLKVLANSTGYGISAEYVRHEESEPVSVRVHADGEDPFEVTTRTPEDTGRYCFPPLAASITGAARLMLALLERLVTDAGGSYVFCDTDSMAIVAARSMETHDCVGGPIRVRNSSEAVQALSWGQVEAIVARFESLVPYDRHIVPGSLLKIEAENFDAGGRQRQLWCWAISAKRYVLYTWHNNEPVIVHVVDEHEEASAGDDSLHVAKASEHGLGHLLNPQDMDDSSTHWITEIWLYMLRQALGLPAPEPPWLDRPALSRVTATSPAVLRWFHGMNAGHSYREQIKPSNFLVLAHPDPLDPSGALPVAPYESNPAKWADLDWIDRRTGQKVIVTTDPFDGTARPGVVRVRTYGDVVRAYLGRPEAKSLAPDGNPVTARTTGVLRRRSIEAAGPIVYVGKEGNRLDERLNGLVTDPSDYRSLYEDPARTTWSELLLPVLAKMPRAEVLSGSKLSRRTIERYIYRGMHPHKTHEDALTRLAINHASQELTAWGVLAPDPYIALHCFLQLESNPANSNS